MGEALGGDALIASLNLTSILGNEEDYYTLNAIDPDTYYYAGQDNGLPDINSVTGYKPFSPVSAWTFSYPWALNTMSYQFITLSSNLKDVCK